MEIVLLIYKTGSCQTRVVEDARTANMLILIVQQETATAPRGRYVRKLKFA